ncbi:MAG: hypothetical protein ACFFCQ_16335, partial [Promethearchaeota archaeon]
MGNQLVEKLLITDITCAPKVSRNTEGSELFSAGFQSVKSISEEILDFFIDRVALIVGNKISHVLEHVNLGDLFLLYLRKISFKKTEEDDDKGLLVEVEKPVSKDYLKPMGREAAHFLLVDFAKTFPNHNQQYNLTIFRSFDSPHFETLEKTVREEETESREYQGVIPIYARSKASDNGYSTHTTDTPTHLLAIPSSFKIPLKKAADFFSVNRTWKLISDRRAKEAISQLCKFAEKSDIELFYPPSGFQNDLDYLIEVARSRRETILERTLKQIARSKIVKNWETFFVKDPPEWLLSKKDILTDLTLGLKYLTAEFIGIDKFDGLLIAVTKSDGTEYWITVKGNAATVVQV